MHGPFSKNFGGLVGPQDGSPRIDAPGLIVRLQTEYKSEAVIIRTS